MNKYKMIACDLDGTLLDSGLRLSNENREAIKELHESGVMFVPATGRTLCEIEEIFNLPEVRFVIYSNGAAIYDKQKEENILFGLNSDMSRFVYDILSGYDFFAIIHKDGKTYTDKEKVLRMEEYSLHDTVKKLVNEHCVIDNSFAERFLSGNIESIVTFFKSEEDRDKCRSALSLNPDINAVEAWDCNLEIFFKDAGKGNALKKLTELVDIRLEDVISIGDSDNDRQMTVLSGLGLVTENGDESLKKVADKVICSNDGHVLSYVKKHYFS